MEVECVSLSLELAWNGLSTDELILLREKLCNYDIIDIGSTHTCWW